MSTVTPEELGKWANSQDWITHAGKAAVRDKLEEIYQILEDDAGAGGGGGGNDGDNSRIKLVVVGDGAVGKTSLLIVEATGKFPKEYVPTVFENYTSQVERNGRTILLHLWDTAGQEDYDRLRPLSYPGSDVVLLCFSTVSESSYHAVRDKWAPEVQHYIPEIPHLLVGTKIDLRNQGAPDPVTGKNTPINAEMGEKLRGEVEAEQYMEVCALDGTGVKELFNAAVDIVLKARGMDGPAKGNANDLVTAAVRTKKKKSGGGCLLQ